MSYSLLGEKIYTSLLPFVLEMPCWSWKHFLEADGIQNCTKQQGFLGAFLGLQKTSEKDYCLDQPYLVRPFNLEKD